MLLCWRGAAGERLARLCHNGDAQAGQDLLARCHAAEQKESTGPFTWIETLKNDCSGVARQGRTPLDLLSAALKGYLDPGAPGDVYAYGNGANYQLGTGGTGLQAGRTPLWPLHPSCAECAPGPACSTAECWPALAGGRDRVAAQVSISLPMRQTLVCCEAVSLLSAMLEGRAPACLSAEGLGLRI